MTRNEEVDHKVHVYLEYHSLCPLVGIGTPSPASECASPRGTHSPACEGVGEFQFGRLERITNTKYVHIKSTTVYAPRRNWDSPNPFLASDCSPPPRNRGEGAH
jgi:hypothetical protein